MDIKYNEKSLMGTEVLNYFIKELTPPRGIPTEDDLELFLLLIQKII